MLFIKVNADQYVEVAQKEKISALPTFKFFKNGKTLFVMAGAGAEKLESVVNELKTSIS